MHFGVVLNMEQWYELRKRLESEAVEFVIGPYERYQGLPEHKRQCS